MLHRLNMTVTSREPFEVRKKLFQWKFFSAREEIVSIKKLSCGEQKDFLRERGKKLQD